jgi:predicted nucleic acid-binding Zn ribbon protein
MVMNKFDDIGSIIGNVIENLNMRNKLNISNIFNCWEKIVGTEIYKKTKPQKIARGILYISVTTSTWANELSLMSGQLIEKINSFIGEEVVKSIRFRQNL